MSWAHITQNQKVPDVFVLNLDFKDSTRLGKRAHPNIFKKRLNIIQNKIEKMFSDDKRFKIGGWGDGFVILFKDDFVDDLIKKAVKVIKIVREKADLKFPLAIRIGINVGNIVYDRDIGKIMGDTMNIAGHLQKSCPGEGGILLRGKVENYIRNKKLLEGFCLKQVIPKGETTPRSCYYYPFNPDEEIPDTIGYVDKVLLNMEELYGKKAIIKRKDFYIAEAIRKTRGSQEVVLTGVAPVWLYLLIGKALHGKVSRLVYSSPSSGDIVIFDNLPH
jgi:hypothetical protein